MNDKLKITKEEFLKKYQKVPITEFQHNVCDTPLVSVLVISFQHEKYIKQCLEGILMQKTNIDYEIIIGEDDSSDGTREICIEYAKKYPDIIRLFLNSRQNNILKYKSPTFHFNSLNNLFNAKGKYIAFCEGDDYWIDPLKLQKQINFLETNKNFSCCAHLSDVIFENIALKNVNRFKNQVEKTVFNLNDCLEYTPVHTSSLVFRRHLLDLDRTYKFGLLELNRDHPIMIILAASGPIMRIPEVMSVYRRNPGGISENSNYATLKNAFLDNIETAKALSKYIKGFYLKAFYMKGHWHRTLVKSPDESYFKKWYHFLYFALSSFYIFPHNLKRIMSTLKNMVFK